MNESNPEHLPVIYRTIASTVVFSSDGKVLLGRKDAKGGGVFSEKWHLPGGGVDKEKQESLTKAAAREVGEEVEGLGVVEDDLEAMPGLQSNGATTKTLKDGTQTWCEMEFNYFRFVSPQSSEELAASLEPGSDFVELRLFTPEELSELDTMPGGIEEKIISGELTANSLPEGRE